MKMLISAIKKNRVMVEIVPEGKDPQFPLTASLSSEYVPWAAVGREGFSEKVGSELIPEGWEAASCRSVQREPCVPGLPREGQDSWRWGQAPWEDTAQVIVRPLFQDISSATPPFLTRQSDQKEPCSGEFVHRDLIIGVCDYFKAQAFSLIKENFLFQIT